MIPGLAPEWTNYNPSDPGITLIELFAYLTEILLYRLNQISDNDLRTYLRLLNGHDWQAAPNADLNAELRKSILALDSRARAVTAEDFENLALAAHPNVARAHAVPDRYLWAPHRGPREERPGHMSVIVVPEKAETGEGSPLTMEAVRAFLEPRRLLATRLHVGPARYVKVGFRLALGIEAGASTASVRGAAIRCIRNYVDPVSGGPDGNGWPFGRPVYISEIYEQLDAIPEVDFVTRQTDAKSGLPLDELVGPEGATSRIQRSATGDVIAFLLDPDELIDPQIEEGSIAIQAAIPGPREGA